MQNKQILFGNVFKNKKVLITGHTGFKGSWLSIWLKNLGAQVYGISDDIPTNPSNFNACKLDSFVYDYRENIYNFEKLKNIFSEIKPDYLFHLAAQSLVKTSYMNPYETWRTNTLGTVSILEVLKQSDKKCISVIITSDKCYENVEWKWGYRENDRIGGIDPYSASKGGSELAIKSYFNSFFKKDNMKIGIGRAGNVIGGGDWSSYRLVPDCVKSWSKNTKVIIRNPTSTRPWQHVLEPLSGYLSLAYNLTINEISGGEAYNFGPASNQNFTVLEVVKEMAKYWEKVQWEVNEDNNFKESGLLKLNCDKALNDLKWEPVWGFKETIFNTVNWYKSYYGNQENILELSSQQIEEFCKAANRKNLLWANV